MVRILNSKGFPDEPPFKQLQKVSLGTGHVMIQDPQNRIAADYSQFLADLCATQMALRESIPESIWDGSLLRDDKPYIFLLSDGDYHVSVGAFSILSVGGAFAPLSTKVLPEEALNFSKRCQSAVILTSRKYIPLAREIQEYSVTQGVEWTVVEIAIKSPPLLNGSSSPFWINESITISPRRPGMVLFTSGTSGPPKGVVHCRSLFYETHKMCSPNDVILCHYHHLWIAGITPFLRFPLAGARLEIIKPDPEVLWERLRKGGVTGLGGSPRLWNLMKEYFESHIQGLPTSERGAYLSAAQNLRVAMTSGGMVHISLLKFWNETIQKPLTVTYGSTELGGRIASCSGDTPIKIERCIGKAGPNMIIRLSDGDHGEIQIKGPTLFSHYLGDEEATRAAFTEDHFFRSGDIAHVVGDDYVFDGRLSGEFTKFRGWKISNLEVEMRLLELPFIQEGCILGAPDPNNGYRVAALVRWSSPKVLCKHTCTSDSEPLIQLLRESLVKSLPVYMLPTALRTLGDDEQIPRTASHKVMRNKATQQYFPLDEDGSIAKPVQLWDLSKPEPSAPRKPWEWGGF